MAILKDLEKQKSKRLAEAGQFVDDCKLLMDNNQAEERDVLRKLGLDTQIKEVEKSRELQLLNEKFEKEYEGKTFHVSEIKDMCMKYRFYFRKSREYKGTIPPDLGSIVNRLVKGGKVILGAHAGYNEQFFVMAPPKMFSGYKTAGQHLQETHDMTVEGVNAFVKAFNDPMLFVKADDDHYVLLKKWGNDMNRVRAIWGTIMQSTASVRFFGWILALAVILMPWIIMGNLPDGTISGAPQTIWWKAIAFTLVSVAWTIYSTIISIVWSTNIAPTIATEQRWVQAK